MAPSKNGEPKACAKCGIVKPLTEFHKHSKSSDGKNTRCKICYGEYNRRPAHRRATKKYNESEHGQKKIREYQLKSKYNLTIEEYDALIEQQDNKCAICGKEETDLHQNGRVKRLAIDHDHKTGRVRGLLCRRCNTVIGLLEENKQILLQTIDYLED